REPEPPPTREPAGDARRSQCPRQGVHHPRHACARHRPEGEARERRYAPANREQRPGRREPTAVAHARGTDGLAAPAPETTIEMQREGGVVRGELARLERAHQLDATARAVGFVARREKGGARLEAKTAMHAGVQRGEPPAIRHSAASAATTNASPGSKVRRSPATRGPTPSR